MTRKSDADEFLSGKFDAATTQLLDRIDEGFYAVDVDWRLQYLNQAAAKFWGRPRDELLGKSMLSLFPKFSASESYQAHKHAFETGEESRIETISTVSGNWVQLKLFPGPDRLSVFFSDLAPRVRLEASLRDKTDTLTLAELAVGIGVWDSDLLAQTVQGTPQFFRLHGLEPPNGPVPLEATRSLRHPDDRDRVRRGFEETLASGSDTYETEYRILRPDGERRWIFGRGRVIRDAAGVPTRYIGIDIDVTERKRQEDQLRVLTHELQHRTNNLLAVVQAIARQSVQTSESLDDFQERFSARLAGLSDSTKLLVQQNWKGTSLSELISTQLAPFIPAETQLALAGPPLFLKPKAVQTLGLALHELATNASKYGAWSVSEGSVFITWSKLPSGIELRWREERGPKVASPRRVGFGRFVTERLVKDALEAAVAIDFKPDGLEWTAVIPSELIDAD